MVALTDLGMPEEMTERLDVGWGTKVELTWDPEYFNAMRGDATDTDDREVLARRLCDAVRKWDLEGPVPTKPLPVEDGEVLEAGAIVPAGEIIPLDPAKVAYLSMPVLVGLLNVIQVASLPNVPTRSASRGRGSTRTSSR